MRRSALAALAGIALVLMVLLAAVHVLARMEAECEVELVGAES